MQSAPMIRHSAQLKVNELTNTQINKQITGMLLMSLLYDAST